MLLYNDCLLSGTLHDFQAHRNFYRAAPDFWIGSKFKLKNQNQERFWHSLASLKFFRGGSAVPSLPILWYPKMFGLTNALGSSDTLSLKFGEIFRLSIRSIIQGVPEILTISWL